ncbi:MAG: acyl-ACP--UDP-N-acetylglucosamine O-acyltransferase [Candidatus Hydrogenedentes bacterium]|nr:acyl-ACP--UDP-N-acetylglucosamine O-acyltransferase [Candidatus Hydrogenedentota bacterium]MBI3118450.1 acyl-ACP--UDP-N-acetylglucosamine O-acyltransferase [Candidatus Hydrogenedentota bacterium]
MSIHPTALIHPGAKLASDVEVQAFTIIEDKVVIGAGSVIGPHCVIGAGTTLGKNNRCYSAAQIGVPPQDLKHVQGSVGITIIGDNNVFREFVTISSGTVYPGDDHERVTRVGSNGLYMASSHIAHDCVVGDYVIMANSAALAGHVTVQDRVIIGGLTGVHQFCVLGTMAFVGGMTRANKDCPPFMIVEGCPARCTGPNTVGLERNGLSKEAILRIRKMYKLLYRGSLNTTQALARIEQEIEDTPERRTLVTFIRASERGLSK